MIDPPDSPAMPGTSQGVYGISVAAELSGVAVQSLRLYERHGLISPTRSEGGTRLYSADDLARLRRISELLAAGVNLAGIGRILDLQDDNAALLAENRGSGEKAPRKAKRG
jgi:DNA-binding transcriptional MerR regulator